jgi:hypothetical protein
VNDEVHRLLQDALRGRLAEVRERIGANEDFERPAEPVADDPEEALRALMVGVLPKAGRFASDSGNAALMSHLRALRSAARSDDLRFLDAWNRVYESLEADADDAFLGEYADLLQWHIEPRGSR